MPRRVEVKVFVDYEQFSFTLSRWKLLGIGLALGLALLGLGGLGLGAWALGENAVLKARLSQVSRERDELKGALARVESKVKEAFQKEQEIRLALGGSPKPPGYTKMPIGGPGVPKGWQVERLVRLAEAEAAGMRYLKEVLEGKLELARSLPSLMPARGVITSGFGWRRDPVYGDWRFHAGVDIAAPAGTPIVAAADGVVVSAGWHQGYGKAVEISHGHGITTFYAHCSRIAVRVGQRVRRGQVIAYIGATGKTTGPHLHYEVRVNGVPQNPERFIIREEKVEFE